MARLTCSALTHLPDSRLSEDNELIALGAQGRDDHPLARLGEACRTWRYGPGVTEQISQRELRNDSGRIMRALDDGASFVVNRNGHPVAELRPLRGNRFVEAAAVLETFRSAPAVDAALFRRDLDEAVDQDVPDRA